MSARITSVEMKHRTLPWYQCCTENNIILINWCETLCWFALAYMKRKFTREHHGHTERTFKTVTYNWGIVRQVHILLFFFFIGSKGGERIEGWAHVELVSILDNTPAQSGVIIFGLNLLHFTRMHLFIIVLSFSHSSPRSLFRRKDAFMISYCEVFAIIKIVLLSRLFGSDHSIKLPMMCKQWKKVCDCSVRWLTARQVGAIVSDILSESEKTCTYV